MINITYDEYQKIRRLSDFALWYLEEREPSGEQYFLDKADICEGLKVIEQLKGDLSIMAIKQINKDSERA